MKSQQSDIKTTKQIRIDAGYHKLLKLKAAEQGTSIKRLLEECLEELLAAPEK